MKKLNFTFICAIVCCTTLFSQTIARNSYEKCVDFVKCKYAEAYFDKKVDDKGVAPVFRNDYIQRIKPQLVDITLENASSRVKVLETLKSYNNGKILIDFIESKKAHFDATENINLLIENLLALPPDMKNNHNGSFNSVLSEEKANLKSFLQKELLPQTAENKTVGTDSTGKDTSAVNHKTTNTLVVYFPKNSSKNLPFKWIIIATAALIVIVLVFFFREKFSVLFTKIQTVTTSRAKKIDEKDMVAKITQLEDDKKNLTDKVFIISFKNDELKREIDKVSRERDLAYQRIRELEKK